MAGYPEAAAGAEAKSWQDSLNLAEVAVKESKFFDGVQFINACVEAFAKEVGEDAETAGKDPARFVDGVLSKLSDEQKASLRKIYEVRGDVISGLGAHKRAASDYACALKAAGGEDAGLAAKKSRFGEECSRSPKGFEGPRDCADRFLRRRQDHVDE